MRKYCMTALLCLFTVSTSLSQMIVDSSRMASDVQSRITELELSKKHVDDAMISVNLTQKDRTELQELRKSLEEEQQVLVERRELLKKMEQSGVISYLSPPGAPSALTQLPFSEILLVDELGLLGSQSTFINVTGQIVVVDYSARTNIEKRYRGTLTESQLKSLNDALDKNEFSELRLSSRRIPDAPWSIISVKYPKGLSRRVEGEPGNDLQFKSIRSSIKKFSRSLVTGRPFYVGSPERDWRPW